MAAKDKLVSEAARKMNAARKTTTNAGRKRSNAERCPCGADTIVRATQRANAQGKAPASDGHHEPCPFYREPCIIV